MKIHIWEFIRWKMKDVRVCGFLSVRATNYAPFFKSPGYQISRALVVGAYDATSRLLLRNERKCSCPVIDTRYPVIRRPIDCIYTNATYNRQHQRIYRCVHVQPRICRLNAEKRVHFNRVIENVYGVELSPGGVSRVRKSWGGFTTWPMFLCSPLLSSSLLVVSRTLLRLHVSLQGVSAIVVQLTHRGSLPRAERKVKLPRNSGCKIDQIPRSDQSQSLWFSKNSSSVWGDLILDTFVIQSLVRVRYAPLVTLKLFTSKSWLDFSASCRLYQPGY